MTSSFMSFTNNIFKQSGAQSVRRAHGASVRGGRRAGARGGAEAHRSESSEESSSSDADNQPHQEDQNVRRLISSSYRLA